MKNDTKKLVTYSMGIALTTLLTIAFPIPAIVNNGYINLGDVIIMLMGIIFGPVAGLLAGGIGSALADIILTYTVYAPFTLVVKGIEGLLIGLLTKNKSNIFVKTIISTATMVLGYFIAESIMFGGAGAIVNVPGNSIQAVACSILATFIYKFFAKNGIDKKIK
ncbi:MAG: ECF transporter S component [Tissierellia bacterium]|nr:ECF transporter S component [Tissierellia bacterium]